MGAGVGGSRFDQAFVALAHRFLIARPRIPRHETEPCLTQKLHGCKDTKLKCLHGRSGMHGSHSLPPTHSKPRTYPFGTSSH